MGSIVRVIVIVFIFVSVAYGDTLFGEVATHDQFITDKSYDEMYEWAVTALSDTNAEITINDYENGIVTWWYDPEDVGKDDGVIVVYLLAPKEDGTTHVEHHVVYWDEPGRELYALMMDVWYSGR